MAGKTLGDRLLELENIVRRLDEQHTATAKAVDALGKARWESAEKVAELRREYDITIALLTKDVERLEAWKAERKKDQDEWARRAWAFGPGILGAVISVLLAALVAKLVAT